jgi:DNA polymerase III alpha subunit
MAAFTALGRPGPLNYMVTDPDNSEVKHNFLVEYARRIRGLTGSKDVLPIFDKLLPETNSLIIFQEQLQRVYQELTGCSGADAEKFRSISAKKKPEEMAKSYSFFMEEASKKIGQESAQQVWDGLTTFSKYSFNKSHSISYCVISYACAWLKHYYPLEWWTSVLCNATKEEVSEKFWPYCHDKVLLPDISLSKSNWAIEGDKIRAPISLLYGIGEKAHEQLMKYAPYRDKEHFCQSIIDYKKCGEDGWGRSSINIGTIYTLLVSGCMDSLYDPVNGLGVNLDDYQTTMARLAKLEGKKIAKKKLDYPVLDYIGRYQIKKDVLPIFGDDLRPHIESPNLYKVDSQVFYRYTDYSYRDKRDIDYEEQVMSGQFLVESEKITELSGSDQKCVVAAYIDDCEVFTYGPNKSKEAKKFQIETCGIKREVVYWPSKDQRLPKEILAVKKGAVAIVVLSRYNVDKDFAVKKIEVVRNPQIKKEIE